MLGELHRHYRDTRVRRALRQQTRRWDRLSEIRGRAFERWRAGENDPWVEYRDRRNGVLARIVWLIRTTPSTREVARNLAIHDTELVAAYSIVVRRCQCPSAARPYHLPTALMLLPIWLETVCTLYREGRLDDELPALERAFIELDNTYPLSIVEPPLFSRQLALGS